MPFAARVHVQYLIPCRIDPDSYITSKSTNDIFNFMQKRNLYYGYQIIGDEGPVVHFPPFLPACACVRA